MTLNRPVIKLDIWNGDWGLPSIDIESLRFLAFTHFSGTEFEINKTNNPFWSPSGALPVAHYGSRDITDFNDLQALLKYKNISPDTGLTKKQEAEAEAYTIFLKEKLHPALLYVWWIDEENYSSITKPWYKKAVPFPANFYYPWKFWQHANLVMEALFDSQCTQTQIETKVYNDAENCLNLLSTRLGESEFMFGTHPTSIDATMYAYLAPLLKTPFKNVTLQNHLKVYQNLQKFVTRISEQYFPQDSQEFDAKAWDEICSNLNSREGEFPNKRRDQFFATILAIIAMISYAISTGIVKDSQIVAKNCMKPLLYGPGEDNGEKN